MNGAKAPPAPSEAPRPLPEGELGVALGLLLEGDGEHPAVLPHLDVRRGHDGGRATHRACGVHPEHGLAHRAQGVGEVELGLHHALEEVGGFSEDDGVDVGHGHVGVVEGPEHRLADQSAEGDVEAAGLVVGLADSDDGARAGAHGVSSRMQMRFCCRHGPEVAWARARMATVPKCGRRRGRCGTGRWP